ncbi:AAA family ATPase [Cyanobium sp. ATX-6F1]|uniref:AAA family ATPase n=1 Tax=Cyanobium sp. ATX-6F1 TaxID=3137388 RepID=UPI0039BDE0C5
MPHLLLALLEEPRLGAEVLAAEGLGEERLLRQLRPGAPLLSSPSPQASPRPRTALLRSDDDWIDTTPSRPQPVAPPKAALAVPVASEGGLTLEREPSPLEQFGRDLTAAARAGQLDPVIGRDAEIRRLIQVLSRRGKNNPVLIGEPGVGKTAIAELLAQRIVAGEVPDSLKGLRLIALDLGALIAGAKFRGQFEERLRSVLAEVSDPDAGVVLFIDELHTVVSSDRSNADAGSLLKPMLARGELRCIGATTPADYRRTVEKDPALERRFQQVVVGEPSLEVSIEILRGLKERYELHHGVTISDGAVVAATRLAARYIADRCLPDKAIDLIDEAAAQLKMEVTSKPQLVEDAELALRRVELALLAAESAPMAERLQWQDQRRDAQERLAALQERWQGSGSSWRSCGSSSTRTRTCATPSPRPSAMAISRRRPGCSTTSSMGCSSAVWPWSRGCSKTSAPVSRCCGSRWRRGTSPMWWPAGPASPCNGCWRGNARSCWSSKADSGSG